MSNEKKIKPFEPVTQAFPEESLLEEAFKQSSWEGDDRIAQELEKEKSEDK
ncbi:hypothetical protein [Psittacicella melopsittaci]|uniref:hypothetical protein n=1 Tax=Psittacicella melopsittaci TaxID=2028576 RepID=UPI001CA60B63|nr:hypothetical protein [Psittacicella melopsittaci]